MVLLPFFLTIGYLWGVAQDRYGSNLAFSIRREEVPSGLDMLGSFIRVSGGPASETEIVEDFIRSQDLVAQIDADLDLRRIWSAAWPQDPVFAFDPSGSIEDLTRFWNRRVHVSADAGSGVITVEVSAFTPKDATALSRAILTHASARVNELTLALREDATRHAGDELQRSREQLTLARQAMTAFRLRSRIVDPTADLQGQMGVLNSLQSQLAEAYVALDLLREVARDGDPRVLQAERRIEVTQHRIAEEREKFAEGGKGPGGADYASLMAEFEALAVDLRFAEEAHVAARAAWEGARAAALRQSRYLMAHIRPTMAERADFPQRWTLLALTGGFLLGVWAIVVLVAYSIRDRR